MARTAGHRGHDRRRRRRVRSPPAGWSAPTCSWRDRDTVGIVNPADGPHRRTSAPAAAPWRPSGVRRLAAGGADDRRADHGAAERSRPPTRRPRTSSSPAPTTAPASIPTRRSSPPSATNGEDRVGERSDTIMVFRRRPGGDAGRRAVVPPRPLRDDRRFGQPRPDQLRLPAGRATAPDRHDLRELRGRHRPLHPGRLLHVQDARRRRRRGRRAVRVPRPRRGLRARGADDRAASRSTATTRWPTCAPASTSTRTRRAAATGSSDRTSDLGRISRQQDFLRRTLSSVLSKGLLNPSVARGLIETRHERRRRHGRRTVAGQVDGVRRRAARTSSPAAIPTYQIEAVGPRGSTAPRCSSRRSTARTCRRCWRCSAARRRWPTLRSRSSRRPRRPLLAPTAAAPAETTEATPPPETTAAPAGPEENTFGIVPPRDVTC